MDVDRESISESLTGWKGWLGKQLPPVLLFAGAAALGRWLPLTVLIAIVFGWLFLIILAQLLGTHSESSEGVTSDSSETDITA